MIATAARSAGEPRAGEAPATRLRTFAALAGAPAAAAAWVFPLAPKPAMSVPHPVPHLLTSVSQAPTRREAILCWFLLPCCVRVSAAAPARLLPLPPVQAQRPFLDCSACQGEPGSLALAASLPCRQIHTCTPFAHRRPPFRFPFLLFSLGFPQFVPPLPPPPRTGWGAGEKARGLVGSAHTHLTGRLPRRTSLAGSGSRRWSWRGHSQGWAATVAAAVRAAAAATATAAAVAASSASAPCAGPARWTRLSPSLAGSLRFHRRRGARWSQSCRALALKLRASAAARLLPRSALRLHHRLLRPGLPR